MFANSLPVDARVIFFRLTEQPMLLKGEPFPSTYFRLFTITFQIVGGNPLLPLPPFFS